MNSVEKNIIFDDIKNILLQNGWDRPLLVETLEQKYKINTNRDLSYDCSHYRFSVEDFIVRSEIFRLILKNGKIHAYLAPEKLEQPLPSPTVSLESPKRLKRNRKNRFRSRNRSSKKFKANQWGSFEPVDNNPGFKQTINKLNPRPAFDDYSDEEEYDDLPLHSQSPVMSLPQPGTSSSYNSAKQIDGPNNPVIVGLQDLSYYIRRQRESNQFNYNELPSFRRCINFQANNKAFWGRPSFWNYTQRATESYLSFSNNPRSSFDHQIYSPSNYHNYLSNNQRSLPQFHAQSPVMSSPRPGTSSSYNSAQQIDGPNNPVIVGLQDLSYYIKRQRESNQFNYNELPAFRRCINFRARQQF